MYNSYTDDHSNNCSCYSIMNPTHWYNAPIPVSQYNFIVDTPPSNSREMRNKAEKMRRDKLNSYISELACLVPLISKSPKRMDKTSILRLTATHLRIYQTLQNGNTERMDMPRHFDQMVLENLVYEQLRGFLLILTGNGKVVFVSHTVENILGHAQTDLMGQSIFNITAQEDHERFRMYITSDSIPEREWRKYFNIRLRRAGPRSESPVYESVNVMGMQRMTNINQVQIQQDSSSSSSSNSREVTAQSVSNEMWIFFVRLYRPEPISDQLVEASKEEYVTRHLVDGKIINCDQRISFIAGYMIEEVSGECAFSFMHRDDVRFVMIALRQMYDKGESRGSSCYRLLSRTGEFIYLRTYGFLEVDATGTVESFICVNTLVAEQEGLKLIDNMKERYSALVKASKMQTSSLEDSTSTVEDPLQLREVITHLIKDLPSSESNTSQSPPCQENEDCPSTPSTEKSSSTSPRPQIPFHQVYIKLNNGKRPSIAELPSSSSKNKRQRSEEADSSTSPSPSSSTSSSYKHLAICSDSEDTINNEEDR